MYILRKYQRKQLPQFFQRGHWYNFVSPTGEHDLLANGIQAPKTGFQGIQVVGFLMVLKGPGVFKGRG